MATVRRYNITQDDITELANIGGKIARYDMTTGLYITELAGRQIMSSAQQQKEPSRRERGEIWSQVVS